MLRYSLRLESISFEPNLNSDYWKPLAAVQGETCPLTRQAGFQPSLYGGQIDSSPYISILSPSTRSYKTIAVSDLPSTQSRWWIDGFLALYLNYIEAYPRNDARVDMI